MYMFHLTLLLMVKLTETWSETIRTQTKQQEVQNDCCYWLSYLKLHLKLPDTWSKPVKPGLKLSLKLEMVLKMVQSQHLKTSL